MSEAKAKDLEEQAQKKLQKFLWWGPKFDEAAELYTAAANQYKILKMWINAGDINCKIAEIKLQSSSQYEAAVAYVEAGNCYKKEDQDRAISAFEEAVVLYTESGKFASAAKIEKEIAEQFEAQNVSSNALEHYQKAADYFEAEESQASANQCLIKVASISALLEQHRRAIEVFEKVAISCLEKNMLKFNAKGYLFQAAICRLCLNDTVAMRETLDKYKDMDYTFQTSREFKLLDELTNDMENLNSDSFSDHVYDFDKISPLDSWKTTMLLRAKSLLAIETDKPIDMT